MVNYLDPNIIENDDEEEFNLDDFPECENISERIFADEINLEMPTEDVENNTGYLFIYYTYLQSGHPQIEFEIPDTWEQWATTFADLSNPVLWETQLVGELQDREGIELKANQMMTQLKNRGIIGDFRIRRNYIANYN